jgi:hypothetical protein
MSEIRTLKEADRDQKTEIRRQRTEIRRQRRQRGYFFSSPQGGVG